MGHCVSAQGVAMDKSEISEITHWPAPRNIHETHMFLGLCGYYRHYVKDLAACASPLHELTQNDVSFT